MSTTKTDRRSWTIQRTLVTTKRPGYAGTVEPSGVETYYRSAVDSRITSDNYPDWRQRIAEHRDATTDLVGTRNLLYCWPYEYKIVHRDFTYTVKGRYPFSNVPTSISGTTAARAAAIAKQKFASRARDTIHSWQGGVFAGELRETARLLASPTKRLRGEVGSLMNRALTEQPRIKRLRQILDTTRRRRTFNRVTQALKEAQIRELKKTLASMRNAIGDTWLEWSFGVKPIIQDANDAAEAFRRLAGGERFEALHIKASHTERDVINSTVENTLATWLGGVPQYAKARATDVQTSTYIIRADYIGESPNANMPLPAIFGLDLSSVLPTAWELVPWSFFVDYFTDVGSAIDAWSIRLINFAWSNHTVRNSRSFTTNRPVIVGQPTNGYATIECYGPFLAKGSLYQVERHKYLPPEAPYKPILRIPGYPGTKWLNIAALANGILALKR